MFKSAVSPKILLCGVGITAGANIIGNLIIAFFMQRKIVLFDAADITIILALIIAAFLGSWFCTKKGGNQLTGYLSGAAFILILVTAAFVTYGENCSLSALVKDAVAVLVGTILGNFWGKFLHNRLRKTRKKRSAYTK